VRGARVVSRSLALARLALARSHTDTSSTTQRTAHLELEHDAPGARHRARHTSSHLESSGSSDSSYSSSTNRLKRSSSISWP